MESKYKRSVKSEQNWWDWKNSKMYLVRTLHYTSFKIFTCLYTKPLTLVSPSALGHAVFSILVKNNCPKWWRMNSFLFMTFIIWTNCTSTGWVSRKKNTLIATY